MRRIAVGFILLGMSFAARAAEFNLRDGDRMMFIGNTFVERDIQHNYLETLLSAQWPDRNITFRNMGWSGDTVFVPARAGSGANKGIDLLVDYVKELRPTVLFVAYGMNESFEGEAGLSRFVDGYNKLLDALAPTKARLVLISPIRHEDMGRPLPDPSEHNKQLKMYTEAIRGIAEKRGGWFVNLFDRLGDTGRRTGKPITENGIHLNSMGYFLASAEVMRELGVASGQRIGIKDDGKGGIAFADERLEKLRGAIRQKNVFFFDRYRPQNDMYIFHGRKHEQGRNAVEIPQFDKFIVEKEAEIAKLRTGK
jgi:lysophospholipase L1-like esterase